MLDVLDAAALRAWWAAGRVALGAARSEIDDLNVYPVPDGDTGTNLLLTVEAVDDAVRAAAPDLPATTRAMVVGALEGARGNSGVILSQLLRGLAEVLGAAPADGPALAAGLSRAADLAYAAVAAPVEGTVLTVVRAAADAAAGPEPDAGLAAVARAARLGAQACLAGTRQMLPALRAAGVVDAGGRGLCVLLEALEAVVTGRVPQSGPQLPALRPRSALVAVREAGSEQFAYEVQYLLRDATEAGIMALRAALAALGDSLLIAGGEGLYNVHVHVNDVGAALEAGVDAGRPFRITVTRFADQVVRRQDGPDLDGNDRLPVMNERPGVRGVVAVASGPGLTRVFEAAGAQVVAGGPTDSPSAAELVAALHRTGARQVVLLPNDPDVRAVAVLAARRARDQGVDVAVVPSCSVVQGLAALAVAAPARPLAEDLATMAAAAAGTRWGGVTVAVRDAATAAGSWRAGDVLGLVEGTVVQLGTDVAGVGERLLDDLLDAAELLTVVLGADAEPGLGERLSTYAHQSSPGVQVTVVDGGQPHYPLLLGAE